MYSLEDIFEYIWAIECDHIDSKSVDDLVKELEQIKKEIQ